MPFLALSVSLLVLLAPGSGRSRGDELPLGRWRAWLDSPGGELPFGLELERAPDGSLAASVWNEPERIRVPIAHWDGDELRLEFDHYASRIEARLDPAGGALEGQFYVRRGPERWGRLPFHARPGEGRFERSGTAGDAGASVAGRWAVDFESDELPAVALLEEDEDGTVRGTFLTATGDHRFLSGVREGRELRLSVFDGAHAFLFHARLEHDGTLRGDFWSLDSWHETWTARRDPEAEVPDAFAQTHWREGASLADLVLADLDGRPRALAELAGRATVLQLFGSWCPNCHDEGAYLAELDERYRGRGLAILGLAFELTGDPARDAEQVRRYAERHGIEYPLFLAGGSKDKAAASEAFPALDRLRSYPTTVFVDGAGRVRAVHSGFAGPATGEAHAELRRRFEALVEELLAEDPEARGAGWGLVRSTKWRGQGALAGVALAFREGPDGEHLAEREERGERAFLAARVIGDAVWIGEALMRLDRAARVLLDPRRVGARFAPADAAGEPMGAWLLAQRGRADAAGALAALADDEPRVRREALLFLGDVRDAEADAGGASAPTPVLEAALAALDDPEPGVRAAAAWTAGRLLAPRPGDAVPPVLVERLGDPNAAVRREAARALAGAAAGNPSLRDALAPLADDLDPLVRAAAREALGE